MVKPSVYAINPDQKKAQDKAREAGQVEVPIQTDNKLQDEYAVKTAQEGARPRGCLRKWQKIVIGVVIGLIVIGCISFFTLRRLGYRCGTDELEKGHRWDELEGDFYDRFGEDGMPRKDWDRSHESSEEGDHDGDHHGHGPGPHHGPHPGPHDHPSHEHPDGRSSEEVIPEDDEVPMKTNLPYW